LKALKQHDAKAAKRQRLIAFRHLVQDDVYISKSTLASGF
jgi:hypothetical protein